MTSGPNSGKNTNNPAFGRVTWFFEEGACLEIVRDYAAAEAML